MKIEVDYNVKLKGKFVIDLTLVVAVIQLVLSVLNWHGDKSLWVGKSYISTPVVEVYGRIGLSGQNVIHPNVL